MRLSVKLMRSTCGSAALVAIYAVIATPSFALEETFKYPTRMEQGRVDVCLDWGKQCGQKTADFYCQVQGYERATRFETGPARPTRLMDGRKCDANFCVGFKSITCFTSAAQPGKGRPWPQRFDD